MSTLTLQPVQPQRSFTSLVNALVVALGMATAQWATAAGPVEQTQQTIRAMSGAAPLEKFDPKSSALVVVDFQNEYFTGKLPIPDGMKALENTRRLIDFADRTGMSVIHVQHIAPEGSAVFALESEGVNFHPLMQPRVKDLQVQKTTVSVFASTDLDSQLKKAKIKTVVIAGLMTHACVAGAARDASPLGYGVVVASDASATRAITRHNGESVSADALHTAALAEIEDTFGDVLTTQQIIDLPRS